jgi:IS5 family transposase
MALYQLWNESNLTGLGHRLSLHKSKEPLDSLLAHYRNWLTERGKRELLEASFRQGITADEGDLFRDLYPAAPESTETAHSNQIVVAEDTSRARLWGQSEDLQTDGETQAP